MTIRYNRIVISSGHSTKCPGAVGYLDEKREATRVVDRVAGVLRSRGVSVETFHDVYSTSQDENLEAIVNFHNSKSRDLDISVHFNCTEDAEVDGPIGTEVWYQTQQGLAEEISSAIATVGLIDRGAKYSDGLYFLRHTDMPAVLIEVAFVNSLGDTAIYNPKFIAICNAIAGVLSGIEVAGKPKKTVVKIALNIPDGVDLQIAVNDVNVLLDDEKRGG